MSWGLWLEICHVEPKDEGIFWGENPVSTSSIPEHSGTHTQKPKLALKHCSASGTGAEGQIRKPTESERSPRARWQGAWGKGCPVLFFSNCMPFYAKGFVQLQEKNFLSAASLRTKKKKPEILLIFFFLLPYPAPGG